MKTFLLPSMMMLAAFLTSAHAHDTWRFHSQQSEAMAPPRHGCGQVNAK
jgi:hypothetical protein